MLVVLFALVRRLDLNLKVVENDLDHELSKNYSHPTSKKRGDLTISAQADTLRVYDNFII